MKAAFNIGDLVRHRKRKFTGVVVKIIMQESREGGGTIGLYKITWDHGHLMWHVEDEFEIISKAENKNELG
jgi:hypothetical protein